MATSVAEAEVSSGDKVKSLIIKYCDERDQIQKKTFTKWMNNYLHTVNCHVDDLYEDLRNGLNLISLLEVLTSTKLTRERGNMRFHRLANIQTSLTFLKQCKIRLVNIRSDDIADGNPKLTLGLIWMIILHLQIEDILVEGQEDLTAKQALLLWAQKHVDGYDGIEVRNFTTSWRDGKAFCAVINRNKPDLINMDSLKDNDNKANLETAFNVAETEFGVPKLLDPEDVDIDQPDDRSIITYLSSLYDRFPQVPSFPDNSIEKEWNTSLDEYLALKKAISEWIDDNRSDLLDQNERVKTIEEAEELLRKLHSFRDVEMETKEAELGVLVSTSLNLDRLSAESNNEYQVPEEDKVKNVMEKWQELMKAYNEREKLLEATKDR